MMKCGHDSEDFYHIRGSMGREKFGCMACDELSQMMEGLPFAPLFSKSDDRWPRPIPVSERLPEEEIEVLAYDGNWWVAVRCDGRWEEPGSLGLQNVPVTHWLPIPPKPDATA